MTTTLQELERRLAAVERELALLRQPASQEGLSDPAVQRAWRLLEKARREKPLVAAAWARAMREIGVSGDAVPPDQLRKMMEDCGVREEENLLSRGIAEMREE